MELKDFTMNNIHGLVFFNVEIKELPLSKNNNTQFFQFFLTVSLKYLRPLKKYIR